QRQQNEGSNEHRFALRTDRAQSKAGWHGGQPAANSLSRTANRAGGGTTWRKTIRHGFSRVRLLHERVEVDRDEVARSQATRRQQHRRRREGAVVDGDVLTGNGRASG